MRIQLNSGVDLRVQLVVVAFSEGGHFAAEVDLYDFIDRVQAGPRRGMVLDNGESSGGNSIDTARDRKGT